MGSLRDREVACSASDRQRSNFESCVWMTVSSQSSHHPQEVLLAQFSLYVHKGGLKPDSFHFSFPREAAASRCLTIIFGWIVSDEPWFHRSKVVPMQLPYHCRYCHCRVTTMQALILVVVDLKQPAIEFDNRSHTWDKWSYPPLMDPRIAEPCFEGNEEN